MTFEEIVDQAIEMVRRRGRVTYRMLKRQFDLDETALEALIDPSDRVPDGNWCPLMLIR